MIYKVLFDNIGPFDFKLLYDAPHNLVWEEEVDGERCYVHRKGACPARGLSSMGGTPFEYYGEPVLIPGSMGTSSFILAGMGNWNHLSSASHGAGRCLSRGQSLKYDELKFREFIKRFKVITPIDPNRQDIKNRPEILKKWEDELKKEAPYAYKEIGPIIKSQVDAEIVREVAELEPIITIKA